jgi:hypothetical protein
MKVNSEHVKFVDASTEETSSTSETASKRHRLNVLSIADLRDGDVVLSSQTLNDMLVMMSLQSIGTITSWLRAKLLISLATIWRLTLPTAA